MKKSNSGITLVALVITIIVLIILAGVSINAVMNDGLITNAKEARDEFQEGKYKEEDALGYLEALTEYVGVTVTNVDTAETNPEAAIPEGAVIIEGDANKGIVIKDSKNNEWVWVEVPKSIFTTATSSTDYTNIETDMKTYAADYRVSDYVDAYYSGCGFASSTDYNNHKYSMLKSVYENGGFWVGRYEAGTRTARYNKNDELTDVVVQQNMYPYIFVTHSQSQERATTLATGGKTSSLMFGIQWDLIMKFIEAKGYLTAEDGTITTTKITKNMLLKDSSQFGNWYNATFTINRGKYNNTYNTTPYNPKEWTDYTVVSNYVDSNQVKKSGVLLTTGAANRNKTLNIYDIAGNTSEWTLEKRTSHSSYFCAYRGGAFNNSSKNDSYSSGAYTHESYGPTMSSYAYSFRSVMW